MLTALTPCAIIVQNISAWKILHLHKIMGGSVKAGLTFTQHLERLFILSADAVGFMLGCLALFLASGFAFGESNTHNFYLLTQYSFGATLSWAVVSLVYGGMRILNVFYDVIGPLQIVTAFLGLNLWLLLLVSFMWLDPTAIQATELLLVVPVLVEFWMAVLAIDCSKSNRRGASPDRI